MGKLKDTITAPFEVFGGGKEGAISAIFDPGNLRDMVTGKSEKEAGKKKADAAKDAADLIRIQSDKAREDIFKLFPQSQQDLRQGFQGALDVFGQSVPAQTQAFQQGNIGAQQQLLAGLPQIQNALFGNQVDFSQLQPIQIQPNLGFTQQQLPQHVDPFAPVQETFTQDQFTTPVNPATAVTTPDIGRLLGGGGSNFNRFQ